MKRRPLFLLGFCFLVLAAAAQVKNEPAAPAPPPRPLWGINGLQINNSLGNTPQQNPKTVASEDGSCLLVWEDGRFGHTSLYAQKIRPARRPALDGSRRARLHRQRQPELTGRHQRWRRRAIVVWQDYRSGNSDIFAQHLNSQGAPLWGNEGVVVCNAAAGQFAPRLVAMPRAGRSSPGTITAAAPERIFTRSGLAVTASLSGRKMVSLFVWRRGRSGSR